MNIDTPANEIEVFDQLICGFVGGIVRRAKEIPEDRWNWSFSERTPTPREICEHSWMWLYSDRQDIAVEDQSRKHRIPELPTMRNEMLALLEHERDAWRQLLQTLTMNQLDESRMTLDGQIRSIRGYLYHMAQHVVSKSGQMTLLYFELGLDGGAPYDAPHPNSVFGYGSTSWPSPRKPRST